MAHEPENKGMVFMNILKTIDGHVVLPHSEERRVRIFVESRRLRNGKYHSYSYIVTKKCGIAFNHVAIGAEAEICKEFGCGAELTLTERLAGGVCMNHSGYGETIKGVK